MLTMTLKVLNTLLTLAANHASELSDYSTPVDGLQDILQERFDNNEMLEGDAHALLVLNSLIKSGS